MNSGIDAIAATTTAAATSKIFAQRFTWPSMRRFGFDWSQGSKYMLAKVTDNSVLKVALAGQLMENRENLGQTP